MQIEEAPGGSVLRRVMRWSLVALLGLGAGGVALVATMPLGFAVRMAGVVLPAGVTLSGTVWRGQAALAGHRAAWQTLPGRSVMAGAWVADLRVTGPETDLAGQAALRPGGARIAPLAGRVGWPLIDAVMPGLEIRCATTADVDLAEARIRAGDRAATGQITLAAGTCARVDGTVKDVPLPAMVARIVTTADGVGMALAAVDAPGVALGNLLVTPDDRLRVTVHATGAAMVPGLPVTGGSQIDLPLALFAQ
jgi:hypothetical protein